MAGDATQAARRWAALCHASALLMFATAPAGIVVGGNLIGPLIVWLLKGADYALVEDQGKESVNFQIIMTAVGIVLLLIPLIGAVLRWVWVLADLAFIFVASVKAYNGQAYRYPIPLRLIR
jgi:hypothetical protein